MDGKFFFTTPILGFLQAPNQQIYKSKELVGVEHWKSQKWKPLRSACWPKGGRVEEKVSVQWRAKKKGKKKNSVKPIDLLKRFKRDPSELNSRFSVPIFHQVSSDQGGGDGGLRWG